MAENSATVRKGNGFDPASQMKTSEEFGCRRSNLEATVAIGEVSVQYVQAERYFSQEESNLSRPTFSISRRLPGDPRA